ncbi:hypothetical protein [Roseiarcus sp.]|uniref:hypothetical protein n=1 Tax=Roseiarcus sp. TaxID=1969460 RepID=UPI003C48D756
MANRLNGLSETHKWHLMVEAAKRGAKEHGYELERIPGRGLSNIWTITKGGKTQRAAIRTTRDRWIAFPPLAKGTKWKTLDEVDAVIVASVDSKEEPETVEVFIFPADEVRKRFGEAYAARKQAGRVIRDNYGMWVALHYPERISRSAPNAIGSGIADEHKPIAVYSIEKLLAENSDRLAAASEDDEVAEALERAEASEPHFTTIAQVMTWAREQVAEIAGVRVEAVKLDLKLEY